MQLSKFRKFLLPISLRVSQRREKSSEVTCVPSDEMDMTGSEISIPEEHLAESAEAKPEVNTDASTTLHLTSSVPRAATTPHGAMTRAQLREARELFPNLDDGEIYRLYKKVTNK